MVFFFSPLPSLFKLLILFTACFVATSQAPPLNAAEQEAVYGVLESLNPEVDWRSSFPDDFCISAPHGVVCDYFTGEEDGGEEGENQFSAHITELNFGYVSDYTPNPPCSGGAVLDGGLFAAFTHLKKLFFYKCFTHTQVSFPDLSTTSSSLEEIIFIENPSLVGPISGSIGNFTTLRRLVLTGTNLSGEIPSGFDSLTSLEEATLSRNQLNGDVSVNFSNLKKLKILDLSQNTLTGNIPESSGNLTQLIKLDLSFNRFSGKIPESLKQLKHLEFLDLSYNRFGNYGVPVMLSEMESLKEVYLSGNFLGGVIPEIWENLGGILRLGLSENGLVGEIPNSMGVYMKNACYIGLDYNKLEGKVPREFETLESVNELKLEGNTKLCVDEGFLRSSSSKLGDGLKLCTTQEVETSPSEKIFSGVSTMPLGGSHLLFAVFVILVFLVGS